MINAEQKVSKFEGILGQMNIRLDGIERRLEHLEAQKADKWEIRIWFIVLMALIAILQFVG